MELPPLPPAFRDRIGIQFPDEGRQLCDALDEPPSVAIRLNPAKLSDPPFAGDPVPWCEEGRVLAARPIFTFDPYWHAGAYYVQEASSMAIQEALRTWKSDRESAPSRTQPLRILDLCAAPGGKSTLLAAWKSSDDMLLANDVVPNRRVVLRENLQKWGAPGCYVGGFGASQVPGDQAWDIVLVDAPCSGEGMFRREPMARIQWSETLIASCARIQGDLLEQAQRLLAPGGLLIFSTCTAAEAENVVHSERLARTENLITLRLPRLEAAGWLVHGAGYLALPHRIIGEGFFLSCFRKTGTSSDSPSLIGDGEFSRQAPLRRSDFEELLGATWSEAYEPFADTDPTLAYLEHGSHREFWRKPPENSRRGKGRSGSNPAIKSSVESTALLAERKGSAWTPSPTSALLSDVRYAGRGIEVALDTALQLLRGESPEAALATVKGWQRIQYRGTSLMWTKQMGNRYNALWPKPWRIRMRLDR